MDIIIGGASRSGKTTLAKYICRKYDFNYIPFDSLISTLENLYPVTGIRHSDSNAEISPHLANLIGEFLKHVSYEDIHTVIDLYQLYPIDYLKMIQSANREVLYLGYPDLTPELKLKFVKRYSREKDWTNSFDDVDMLEILKLWIGESRLMREQCSQNNISYFDTGHDFDKGLASAIQYIENLINCSFP